MEVDLSARLENLSASQKKIADFITKNLPRLVYMTEQDIARELSVSAATVSRFWRAIGFVNNKDFKNYLRERMTSTPANKLKDILSKTDQSELLADMFRLATGYLDETLVHISQDQLDKTVQVLANAGTVYLYGPGPCECLVHLLEFRLNRLGLHTKVMAKSGHEIFESIMHITSRDAVMLFGFTDMLREVKVILDYSRQIGCTSILITDLLVSDMIAMSDLVLFTARGALWEFHSMVAPLALIECIAVGVSRKNEDHSLAKLNDLQRIRRQYDSSMPRY